VEEYPDPPWACVKNVNTGQISCHNHTTGDSILLTPASSGDRGDPLKLLVDVFGQNLALLGRDLPELLERQAPWLDVEKAMAAWAKAAQKDPKLAQEMLEKLREAQRLRKQVAKERQEVADRAEKDASKVYKEAQQKSNQNWRLAQERKAAKEKFLNQFEKKWGKEKRESLERHAWQWANPSAWENVTSRSFSSYRPNPVFWKHGTTKDGDHIDLLPESQLPPDLKQLRADMDKFADHLRDVESAEYAASGYGSQADTAHGRLMDEYMKDYEAESTALKDLGKVESRIGGMFAEPIKTELMDMIVTSKK